MPNIPPRGIHARHNQLWKNPSNVHARVAGIWKNAEFVWVRRNGAWELLWARSGGSPASATIVYAPTQVTVTWVPATPAVADTYRIYRPDGSLAGSVAAPNTSFVDVNPLPLNGAYTVKGVLGADESAPPTPSNVLDLRLAPTGLSATVLGNGTQVDLAWSHAALGRPDEYDIYRDGAFIATVSGFALGWSDMAPPRGSQPVYAVVPVLTDVAGLAATITPNVPAAPPASVVLTATTDPISNLRLTWSPPVGTVTAYEVSTSPDGSAWTVHGDVTSPSDWSTTGSGYMRVRATSPGGNSLFVTAGPVAAINDVTPPANATITSWKPEASYGRMVVRFTTPATDVAAYKVQENVDGGAWTDVTGWIAAANSTNYDVVGTSRSAGQTANVRVLLRDTSLNANAGATAAYVLAVSPIIVDPSGDLSGTWRGSAWRNDGTRSSTEIATGWTSSGHNIGVFIYGTTIDPALGDKTIVSATIDYWREDEGGTSGGVSPLFWTHDKTSRSAGAPVLSDQGVAEASRIGSSVARNTGVSPFVTSRQWALPVAFVAALQAGTAKGIAMYRGYQGSGDPDSYYMLWAPGGSVGGSPSRVGGRLSFNHLG